MGGSVQIERTPMDDYLAAQGQGSVGTVVKGPWNHCANALPAAKLPVEN